jgi:hypothetical protein
MKSDCISILANRPEDANSLSPLVPLIGYRKVEHLYRAMLFDTIAVCLTMPGVSIRLNYRPPKANGDFQQMLSLFQHEESDRRVAGGVVKIQLVPQQGKTKASRLSSIFKDAFYNGFKKVIVITGSCPALNAGIVKAGLLMLKNYDAIIGPSFDGNYYLLGMARFIPEAFIRLDQAEQSHYFTLKTNLEKAGAKIQELEISYMVSSAEELNQLIDDIECWRKIGDDRTALHTERFLRTLA